MHGGDANLGPAFRPGLHNRVPLREILQTLGKRLPAIEGLGDLISIDARELKESMSAHGEDRRPHFGWVLVQELVCRDDRNPELAGLGEHRFDACAVGHKVLDFIAVEGEDGSLLAGEHSVF